jgi:hypothetical protein
VQDVFGVTPENPAPSEPGQQPADEATEDAQFEQYMRTFFPSTRRT